MNILTDKELAKFPLPDYPQKLIDMKRAVAEAAHRETLKMVGETLYAMIVESGDHTDLTLEGEKRKLCFISNRLRPIINSLQQGETPALNQSGEE